MWIYSKYITKNGRRVYPKNSKFFRFWVDDEACCSQDEPDADEASDQQDE